MHEGISALCRRCRAHVSLGNLKLPSTKSSSMLEAQAKASTPSSNLWVSLALKAILSSQMRAHCACDQAGGKKKEPSKKRPRNQIDAEVSGVINTSCGALSTLCNMSLSLSLVVWTLKKKHA